MKKKVKKAEYKGIDTTEMLAALDELEASEGLDKRMLLESIQNALVSAYKKDFGSDETNVVIEFDKKVDNGVEPEHVKIVTPIEL